MHTLSACCTQLKYQGVPVLRNYVFFNAQDEVAAPTRIVEPCISIIARDISNCWLKGIWGPQTQTALYPHPYLKSQANWTQKRVTLGQFVFLHLEGLFTVQTLSGFLPSLACTTCLSLTVAVIRSYWRSFGVRRRAWPTTTAPLDPNLFWCCYSAIINWNPQLVLCLWNPVTECNHWNQHHPTWHNINHRVLIQTYWLHISEQFYF